MIPTKEQLKNLYNEGLTQCEISTKLGISQSAVSNYTRKYEINIDKKWTDEELEYLEKYYGTYSLQRIGKKLGRTPQAVESKARRLGMTCKFNSGKLNATELAQAFKVDSHVVIYNWIKNKGLRASFKVIKSIRKYWRIDINVFWKWAYKNKDIINFAKLEKNVLGPEPKWVDSERKKDTKEKPERSYCKWTKEEDKKLMMLWVNNYTAKEIGEIMGKTGPAVSRRKRILGLALRKIPLKWKEEEIKILLTMKLNGSLDKEIAMELGRGEGEVSWKRNELIKQGKLNWKYREKAISC